MQTKLAPSTQQFRWLFSKSREYAPENVYALSHWMQEVRKCWKKDNPLALNESLLAMQSYAPYHHLYAVSLCFCVANSIGQDVPDPVIAYKKASSADLVGQVVDISGASLNTALEAAANEPLQPNRVFSPQNWIKTKACLAAIRQAISQYFLMLPAMPGGVELRRTLNEGLKMEPGQFEERWAAD